MDRVPLRGGYADLTQRQVVLGEAATPLTEREAELLAHLARHPGEWFTPEALLVDVWGYSPNVESRTAYATMNRLRGKLGTADPIESRRGLGYRLVPLAAPLPAEADPFVGRAGELARLEALLDAARLVTLVGPGGAGKTRLSLRYAAGRAAVPCDLSSARTAADVDRAVTAACGGPVETTAPALLVLDNFEQVTAAAPATVSRWLAAAPGLRVLVTSRHALRIAGEHVLEVGPLDAADAAALFAMRAAAAGAEPADPDVVAELVLRLDGLPLAIELAAASVLPADALLARLRDGRPAPDGARAGVPERHRSLEAVLAWSWDLLAPDERAALAQASVFRGSFGPDAAEAVITVGDPLRALAGLRAKSLLTASGGRFGLLQTVRAFARRQLAGDALAGAMARHRDHMLAWGGRLAGAIDVDGREDRLAELARDLDDLLAVADRGSRDDAAAALTAAFPALRHRGRFDAWLERLDRAGPPWPPELAFQRADLDFLRGDHASAARWLDLAEQTGDPLLAVRCVWARGRLAYNGGDVDGAVAAWTDAASRASELAAHHVHAHCLEALGIAALAQGDLAASESHVQQALGLARATGARWLEAHALMNLGNVRRREGRPHDALACYDEALHRMRALSNRVDEGFLLKNLALVALDLDDLDDAGRRADEALAFTRRQGLVRIEAELLWVRGRIAHARGELYEAEGALQEAIALFRTRGVHRLLALGLAHLGAVLADLGRADAARAAFDESRDRATGDPKALVVLDVAMGHLALCQAGSAPRLAAQQAAARGRQAWTLSDDIRCTLRTLERRLRREPA